MAYTFKYQLNGPPEPSNNGAGVVKHDVSALSSFDGVNYQAVPGRHKTVSVPAVALQAVMNMPNNPAAAKIAAYKSALALNLDTTPIPVDGWDAVNLTLMMTADDAAEVACTAAIAYLTVTLNQTFPIAFVF